MGLEDMAFNTDLIFERSGTIIGTNRTWFATELVIARDDGVIVTVNANKVKTIPTGAGE